MQYDLIMLSYRYHSLSTILFVYFAYIASGIFNIGFGGISSAIELLICFLLFFKVKSTSIYLYGLTIALVFVPISFINHCSALHIIMSMVSVFFLLMTIWLVPTYSFTTKALKITFGLSLFLIALNTVCMASPQLYDLVDGAYRYNGVFAKGNTSVNTFIMLSILSWEICKVLVNRRWLKKCSLLFIFIAYLAYVYTSQTRSMLFAVPYWLYQIYHILDKRLIIAGFMLVAVSMLPMIIELLQTQLRFNESDHSFSTRAWLYKNLIEGIIENKVVIPHGAHTAWDLSRYISGEDNFSPHNDFLCYLYEMGIGFFVWMYALIKKVLSYRIVNFNLILILLAQAGAMLHNMWFSPFVWLPVFFILCLYRDVRKRIV